MFPPSQSYEPYEPTFDDEEPTFEPTDADDVDNLDGSARQLNGQLQDGTSEGFANGATTPHANGNGNVVVVGGDGGGAGTAAVKKNAVLGLREKKIPADKRSTTPYMTKYERARVLGTRALQIRYAFLFFFPTTCFVEVFLALFGS